jgi:C_GCAxxG_C_C family probable redox protein
MEQVRPLKFFSEPKNFDGRQEQIVKKKPSERAQELFAEHCNCAQSVYAASGVGGGMTEEQRLAVAVAFGGGVARKGEVCGALTGALMAQGERAMEKMATDRAAGRDEVYAAAQKLMEEFRTEHGSILCRELTGCRMDTEEGHRDFMERKVRETVCMKLVAFAADRAAKAD